MGSNGDKRSSHRSSSRKQSSRANNLSSDKQIEGGFLAKTASSSNLNQKYMHTASLKFNNILKDIGGYTGPGGQVWNYEGKKGKDSDVSKMAIDTDKTSSKYGNLESSVKLKETSALKPNEIFMMNTNTNHHYNYFHNPHKGKTSAREHKKLSGTANLQNLADLKQNDYNFTNNDSSNLDISFKGRNPIMGVSALMQDVKPKKQSRKSSRTSKKIEDPAIPFPNSEKHRSSKLASNESEYTSSR